jgi:hypothetical protein
MHGGFSQASFKLTTDSTFLQKAFLKVHPEIVFWLTLALDMSKKRKIVNLPTRRGRAKFTY